MKKLSILLAILLSLTITFSIACTGNVEESSSSASTGGDVEAPPVVYGPEEGWLGNWTRPDMDGGSSDTVLECTHKCYVCGKCVDIDPDNDEDTCTDKCYAENGRILYVFNATDKRVDLQGGVKVEDDHIGKINNNPNAVITFEIKAEQDAVVCIGATVSEMNEDKYVASLTPIYVNDEKVFSRACMKAGSGAWTNFKTIWLGCVSLKKGVNKVQFTNVNSEGQQYNFKDFSFLSSVKLDWTREIELHECKHKDSVTGKCTDYTCNKLECLDKAEDGWKSLKIDAGDSKVLKYNGNGEGDPLYGLWNSKEGCIGEIANVSRQQTVIFSFTASEETYLRLSLNTSINSKNTEFASMWELTMDGVAIETEGRSGTADGKPWTTYVDGTVAYVKVSEGTHTFMMVHKNTSSGDNIKYLTIYYQNGELAAAQAKKPQS